jgi:hypothetical protein
MNFLFVCCRAIMHTPRRVLLSLFGKGRAMPVAVCRRPFTTEARDKSQDSPRGICGGPSEIGTAFPIHLPWTHAVAQLAEALCYKREGRGFVSRW